MKPGLNHGLAFTDYLRAPGLSFSTLKHMRRTPAHARERWLHPSEPTAAQQRGTAIHTAILEPERFAREFVQRPDCDRRTKAGKAVWAEFTEQHPTAEILTIEDMEVCKRMADAAANHPFVNQLLSAQGHRELSLFWRDEEHGADCKGRIDLVCRLAGDTFVCDFKSTEGDGYANASDPVFSKAVANLGYHMQAAFYLDGLAAAVGPATRRHLLIACEAERPWAIAVYELIPAAIAQGRAEIRGCLAQWVECEKTGTWPAYPLDVQNLDLPKFAQAKEFA